MRELPPPRRNVDELYRERHALQVRAGIGGLWARLLGAFRGAELGVAERQLLADDASPGEARRVGEGMSRARRTAAASSAIISTETGPSGIAVRAAPRLSKAVRR